MVRLIKVVRMVKVVRLVKVNRKARVVTGWSLVSLVGMNF